MSRGFEKGDKVICILTGVQGIVEKFYCPTACAEQTMVITHDGRRYHAPTNCWRKENEHDRE